MLVRLVGVASGGGVRALPLRSLRERFGVIRAECGDHYWGERGVRPGAFLNAGEMDLLRDLKRRCERMWARYRPPAVGGGGQVGVCEICGKAANQRDHWHAYNPGAEDDGRLDRKKNWYRNPLGWRGWTCVRCNTKLTHAAHDPWVMRVKPGHPYPMAAWAYLNRYKAEIGRREDSPFPFFQGLVTDEETQEVVEVHAAEWLVKGRRWARVRDRRAAHAVWRNRWASYRRMALDSS